MDIEFNDGCGSQFKCIGSIESFASRDLPSICVFFETIHDKSKSDGLGCLVKAYASTKVAAMHRIIWSDCAKELLEFC